MAEQKFIMVSMWMALSFAAIVALLVLGGRLDIPIGIPGFLLWAVLALGITMSQILSRMRTITATVRKPPGLIRWIDVYASADPVPNGPTMTRKEGEGVTESIRISNLASMFADHTAYWDNLDEFVLRVVRECAETANSPWRTELPPDKSSVNERAAWRVRWLQRARWIVIMTWLAVAGIIAFRHAAVTSPLDLGGWGPSWLEALAKKAPPVVFLEVLIAFAILGTLVLVRLSWRYWVSLEQQTVLDHKDPKSNWLLPLIGIWTIVWLVLTIGFGLAKVANEGLSALSGLFHR